MFREVIRGLLSTAKTRKLLTRACFVVAVAPAGARAQAARACVWQPWEPVRQLTTVLKHPVYVETPSVVPVLGGTALIGYPVYLWQAERVFADSGASGLPLLLQQTVRLAGVLSRRDDTATSIPMPPGVVNPLAFHAVPGTAGTAEAFWGTAPDTFASPGFGAKEVWRARFDGQRWSNPEAVFEADRLFWSNTQPALSGAGEDTQLALPAFGTEQGTFKTGIVFLRRRAHAWVHDWIELGFPPSYVALTSTRAHQPVVAFITGGDGANAPMRYGVYVVRSKSEQGDWGTPQLIAPIAAPALVWLPVLVTGQDGTLHLLWVDQPRGNTERAPMLYHMQSTDGGEMWSSVPSLSLPEGVDALRGAVVGPDDLIFVMRFSRSGKIGVATWGASTWSNVTQPFAEPALSLPTLALTSARELYVTWGTGRPGAMPSSPEFAAPALMFARRRAACADSTAAP
jgi:hypothetical protein